jgi:hypothetical protein
MRAGAVQTGRKEDAMKMRMKRMKWIVKLVRKMPGKMIAYIGIGIAALYIIRMMVRGHGHESVITG